MPVSFLPCLTSLILIGVPLCLFLRSRRAGGVGVIISVALLSLFFLFVYLPGGILLLKAKSGDARSKYRYAHWLENHPEQIGAVILWPATPDVLGGFAWLERAADQDYPPAVWLVGQRLKYGEHVPEPPDWRGPNGNVFQQPEKGQRLMERATGELGYRPPHDERTFYWQHYRKGLPP